MEFQRKIANLARLRYGSANVQEASSVSEALEAVENKKTRIVYFDNYDPLCVKREGFIEFSKEKEETEELAKLLVEKEAKLCFATDYSAFFPTNTPFSLSEKFRKAKMDQIAAVKATGVELRVAALSTVCLLKQREEEILGDFLSTAILKGLNDETVIQDLEDDRVLNCIHLRDAFFGLSQLIEAGKRKITEPTVISNTEVTVGQALKQIKR